MNTINVIWTYNVNWEYCRPWTQNYATGNSASIIILVHWCCCSELIVHTNAGITVKCLLSDVWYFTFFQSIFSWGEITCVWVLNQEIIISFEVYSYCTNATIYYIILTGVPVCSIIFSHLVIQYTVLDLVNLRASIGHFFSGHAESCR
jgi:hypothetical protein